MGVSPLEGRRPRRLATPRDIKRVGTFVPVGTEAGAPPIAFLETFVPTAGEAAVSPIVPATFVRFVRIPDDRPWRAGGLAGFPEEL